MKIIYILFCSWGGIPHYTAELANAVAKYADVYVIKPKDANDSLFSSQIKLMPVFDSLVFSKNNPWKIFSVSNVQKFLSFKELSIIKEINPDILHIPGVHYPQIIFIHLLGIDKKYPIVGTFHAVYKSRIISPRKTGTNNYLVSLVYTLVNMLTNIINFTKIIVLTNNNKNQLLQSCISGKKIAIIPHGAYTFFKDYETDNDIHEGNSILFFGYILPSKGLDILLMSMPKVIEKFPDVKLIIAGEGDLNIYRDLINKCRFNLEIHNNFIPNEEVPKLFKRSKALIAPYLYEPGSSGVISIAMAFGTPVIVTDVGELSSIIGNQKEGIVIPAKDPEALAEAVIFILSNEFERKKMADNSYKKSLDLSWDSIARKHLLAYEESRNNLEIEGRIFL